MPKPPLPGLSRRERQVIDIIYPLGKASGKEILQAMEDAPSYSAVRALLRVMEAKGHLRHIVDNDRFIYYPTQPIKQMGRSAIKRVLTSFFRGSTERAVAALLEVSDARLTDAEAQRISKLIEQAREQGR